MTRTHNNWVDANQRYLVAKLAVLRSKLKRHVTGADAQAGKGLLEEYEAAQSELEEAAGALPEPSAIDRVCAVMGLSAFESEILLLCAGVELDSAFGPLCEAAQGDSQRRHATFSLALAALTEPHWSALSPRAPLRRWSLVEMGNNSSLVASPLRIDERVLHFLGGVDHLDDRLAGLVEPMPIVEELVPSHGRLAEQIVEQWRGANPRRTLAVILLCGEDDRGKLSIASAASRALGLRAVLLHAANLCVNPRELEAFIRLWERESALSGVVLCVDVNEVESSDAPRERAVSRLIESLEGPLIVACRERRVPELREAVLLRVGRPNAAEQRRIWEKALGPAALGLNGELGALVSQFCLNVSAVRSAVAEASAQGLSGGVLGGPGAGACQARAPEVASETPASESVPREDPRNMGRQLWDACRLHTRPRLAELAQRIDSAHRWEDIVLPEPQMQILRRIVTHVRHRSEVYEGWGFSSKGTRGLGISALFAGTSGTGKTMAAEVLANDLRLDLYRIDLSSVVSKYIGETEKNLRRVFDAAEEGGAILLFDEADALFGKRSDVKDSHDRYANIEISYLLQRMEAYRGLAILTTNMKNALDPAFLRRIRFVVQFPFPDAALRAEIWRRVFPQAAPTDSLDYARLSRLSITGGNIRNIALNGAFLAADAGEPVQMKHLLNAARDEYGKLEKPLTEAEVGGWPSGERR